MVRAPSQRLMDGLASAAGVGWFALGVVALARELPAAGGAQAAAIGANIALFVVLIALFLVRRPAVRKAPGWRPRLAAAAGFFAPLVALLLPRAPMSPLVATMSSALIFAGAACAVWAALRLGRGFGVLPQARRLETGGPYRFARHPIYLAELTMIVGAGFEYAMPWPALLPALAFAAQLPRMGFEERVLAEAFPEYAAYARRTARLLPGVY